MKIDDAMPGWPDGAILVPERPLGSQREAQRALNNEATFLLNGDPSRTIVRQKLAKLGIEKVTVELASGETVLCRVLSDDDVWKTWLVVW